MPININQSHKYTTDQKYTAVESFHFLIYIALKHAKML